jgi:membrane fusion protein, multidrug efflux system
VDIGQPSGTPAALERGVPVPPPRAAAGRVSIRTQAGRRLLRLVALGALLLAVLAAGGHWLHRQYTHVFLDDARIAADMVTVASRVPGWATEVRVIAGDEVPRGKVLVRIDGRETEIALRELEARLAGIAARRREIAARIAMVDRQTQSQQEAQQARLAAAQASLPAAEAERIFAESEFARARELIGSGSGTRQRLDQTRSALEAAHHRVRAAAAEIQNAEAQLAAAGAAREELNVLARQLESLDPQERELRAQRERAAIDLADRTITMPFDGVVDRVFVDAGEYVAAGQRLLMLHDPSRVRVEANVKETEIRFFRPGTPVAVTVDAYPGRRFEGVVERVGAAATSEFALLPAPNPSGNFTRITQRLPIRVALRPPPEGGLLRPGMLVHIEADARE